MIGVIVVTHGMFGKELIGSFNMITGAQEKLSSLSLLDGDDVSELADQISELAQEMDDGEGVLVLVDIFGGSPCNSASRLLMRDDIAVEVVAGVNLPMLIKVTESRNSVGLKRLAEVAVSSVAEYTFDVREQLQHM